MAVNQHGRQFTAEDLQHRFDYHPPRSEERRFQHQYVRSLLFNVAARLDQILPDGREKAVVVTKVEEAMFWANAALARSADENAPKEEKKQA